MSEPAPDLMWTNGRFIAADIPIDATAARQLLPPGLTIGDDATATVFVADYPTTSFGPPYREAAVLLHASDATGVAASHCPFMLVDDDSSLIMGRELLGFPKKLGVIDVDYGADTVVASATRMGTELLRVEAEVGDVDPSPPAWSRRTVNVVGSLLTGMYFLELPVATERVHHAHHASVAISFGSIGQDNLTLLSEPVTAAGRSFMLDTGDASADLPILGEGVGFDWAVSAYFARSM
ncbi:MAG: acetoacetate decarboxylase family protein [Acidimicrobiia bacterium]|nr:acetoacetate decarboxylase family protein [Acidimicrobiia bacterium]